jgi:hypothetical protein
MRRIRSVTAWLAEAGVDVIAIQRIAPAPILRVRHSFSVDFWIGHNKRLLWRLMTGPKTLTHYSAEFNGCRIHWTEGSTAAKPPAARH